MDWTDVAPAPFGVSYYNSYIGIHSIGAATGSLGAPASATYPTANSAFYIPFRLLNPTRITKLWALNGAAAKNNLDLGIYDAGGVRLVSIGSTAQSGTNAMQIVALGTAIRLGVGLFYMAVAADNTATTFFRTASGTHRMINVMGMAEQATAFPLPATATFAAFTGSSPYIPVIGFVSEEG